MKALRIVVLLFFLGTMSYQSVGQNRIKINTADELPRRSVTIKGKAVEVIENRAQLQRLNKDFIKNLEADLAKYEISDKATLKGY